MPKMFVPEIMLTSKAVLVTAINAQMLMIAVASSEFAALES